jgi:hypothetical protein
LVDDGGQKLAEAFVILQQLFGCFDGQWVQVDARVGSRLEICRKWTNFYWIIRLIVYPDVTQLRQSSTEANPQPLLMGKVWFLHRFKHGNEQK